MTVWERMDKHLEMIENWAREKEIALERYRISVVKIDDEDEEGGEKDDNP